MIRALARPSRRVWVYSDPIADFDGHEPRTITVHEDEPDVDTGILSPDERMIRRRAMGPIGFVRFGER